MSALARMRISAHEFAVLLVELDAEGEALPSGAFDELAEAVRDRFPWASEAVLGASEREVKIALGLQLARLVVATTRKRRASEVRARGDDSDE